jgi:hypothetical protein
MWKGGESPHTATFCHPRIESPPKAMKKELPSKREEKRKKRRSKLSINTI